MLLNLFQLLMIVCFSRLNLLRRALEAEMRKATSDGVAIKYKMKKMRLSCGKRESLGAIQLSRCLVLFIFITVNCSDYVLQNIGT